MLNCWCMTVVTFILYHTSSAGKFTRQCNTSNGKCGINTNLRCDGMFGPGWVAMGKCCNSRPCCVECCPDTFGHFGGSTYLISCRFFSKWSDAKTHCESRGGNLTSIETEEENNYLKYVLKLYGAGVYWIGLSDTKTEGSFQWLSSQQLTFTDWHQGPPI